MHPPPATPDHHDARAFIRALRLSTTPAHLTPARPSSTLFPPSASPYHHSSVSLSHTPSQASSSAHPCDMTEDEERAMEAELEHELTALIQQDADEEEAEQNEEEQTEADQERNASIDQLNTSKQHSLPSSHEHKDDRHNDSINTSNSNDMLFPMLHSTTPSTPTRHFLLNTPTAFHSPPVRQLPSPTQLHSLLLRTESRLREREQQVQMAAEVGEALLRQQEEREEELRQWRQRAEEAESEVERVRSEMERLQERNITLLTQLREAEAATDEQKKKAADIEDQLTLRTTQLTRERDKRREEERQQSSTAASLVADNATLTTTLATLHTQLHSSQQRITLLTQQHDTERANTAHYRAEAEAWERLADERERKAKEREDELLEELDSLSYRCRQLQEAVPMSGPSVVGGRGGGGAVYEAAVVVEGYSNEVKEVREVGKNQRLSMMPYESLLAELEGELQAEIAARQTRATVDEMDKENVSREANTAKDQLERTTTASTDEKLRTVHEPAHTSVLSAGSAVDVRYEEQPKTTSKDAAVNTLSAAATAHTQPASPAPISSPACPPNTPSPPSPSSSASSAAAVDVLREYFHLATLSVKLSSVETNVSACNVNVNELYQRVIREDVAFHRWHHWIQDRMRELKPATTAHTATNSAAAATPAVVAVAVVGRGVLGAAKGSPGMGGEREREKVSEKVLYAHGSSVSVSMKQRPPAAAAAKKAASTGGGLLQGMRRGWARG